LALRVKKQLQLSVLCGSWRSVRQRKLPYADGCGHAAGYSFTVRNTAAFAQAVAAINNDKAGGAYTITLNGNLVSDLVVFAGDVRKTITLKGDGTTRAIANNGNEALFTVSAGITLIR
jgi:hypothetical protein